MMDHVETIHPTGTGEPLMAEGFWRLVEKMQGRASPKLSFHTNGLLLTDANIAKLLEAPIGHVVLSMDAATAPTYGRIRGGKFDRVVRNGTTFAQQVKARQPHALLQLAMVLMVENYAEASEFVRLAHRMGFKAVSFDHLTDPNSSPGAWVVKKDDFYFEYYDQWIRPGTRHSLASDEAVVEALDVADRLGLHVYGLNLFSEFQGKAHSHRPSREHSARFY